MGRKFAWTCLSLVPGLLGCAGCGNGNSDSCASILSVLPGASIEEDATVPDGCWLVEQTLYVSNNATLTIQPGATLKFSSETGLEVDADGVLSAQGTTDKPIVFTGLQSTRGSWNGIIFTNSESASNKLSRVTIEFAGAKELLDAGAKPFRAGLYLDSSGYDVRVSVSDSIIQENLGYGIYLDSTAILPVFSNNLITKNSIGSAYTYASSTHNLSAGSSYLGNDQDYIYVNTAYEFGDADRAWAALDVPYHLDGAFLLYQHLTLAPGATLLFTKDSVLKVLDDKGGLSAIGTAEKPIIFSGTEPTPGYWGGLYFSNTNDTSPTAPRTRFDHVTIEYGGAYKFNDGNAEEVSGNMMLDSSGWSVSVRLDNSILSDSTGFGAWLACEATIVSGNNNSYPNNSLGEQGQEDNCGP